MPDTVLGIHYWGWGEEINKTDVILNSKGAHSLVEKGTTLNAIITK